MSKKALPYFKGYNRDRVKAARQMSAYQEIDFDGSRWPFLVNGFGLKRAEEATGKDVQALLYDVVLTQSRAMMRVAKMEQAVGKPLQEATEADYQAMSEGKAESLLEQVALAMQAAGFTKNMEAYASYFFAGIASFYPDVQYEDILFRITPDNMQAIEPVVAVEIARLYKTRDKASTNGASENGGSGGTEGN